MAAKEDAVSFDEIIQADRARRRNEKLAEEIFGKGRKAPPTGPAGKNQAAGSSLSSRAGIVKRSNSNTPKSRDISDALRGIDSKSSRPARTAKDNPVTRAIKKDLLFEAVTGNQKHSENGSKAEFNIRGIAAGSYTVIGSNFAPGTTAADIESALLPFGGEMQSCKIVTATPTVMAEMIYSEKDKAELVITRFNNAKADGRLLHLYMHYGPPHDTLSKPTPKPDAKLKEERDKDLSASYANQREQSDRNRRRAEPTVEDRSYGFDTKGGQLVNKDDEMDIDTQASAPQSTAPDSAAAPPPSTTPLPPSAPRVDPPRSARPDDRNYDRRNYAPRDQEYRRYDDQPRQRGGAGTRSAFLEDRRLNPDNYYRRPGDRGGYR